MKITLAHYRPLLLTVGATIVLMMAAAVHAQSGQPGSQPPPGVNAATHAKHVQQGGAAHASPPVAPGEPTMKDLVDQIAGLRAEVARLQAALAQGHSSSAGMPMQQPQQRGMQRPMRTPGMGQMGAMQPQGPAASPGSMQGMSGPPGMGGGAGGGMGMMDMDNMMMGGMSSAPGMGGGMGSGMGMDEMMRMMGMGNMPMGGAGSPAAMSMPSALPGFPGASHIYHIGATGFYLDHPGHITLTLEQQTALNQQKEQALLEQAELQRKVEQVEQDLWVLTGSDTPDAGKIEAKAREIEKLRADQRIAFIRAVGNAATLLTDEQRKQLTGMLPANPTSPDQPMQPQGAGGAGMGGMSDM